MGSRLCPDWSEMIRECLIDIFSRLSMGERWIGPMLVSKTWMNACKDPSLNSVLDLENWFMSSKGSWCLTTHASSKWWTPQFEATVDSTIKSVVDKSQGSLKEIQVRHYMDIGLFYVAHRCPNLEVLSVRHSPNVTDESMKLIALNCPKLMELDVSYPYEISGDCLMLFGRKCKNLHILRRNMMDHFHFNVQKRRKVMPYTNLPPIGDYWNVDTFAIAYMHQLKHLELQFSGLTDEGLAKICRHGPNLEYLDLYRCRKLTLAGVTNSTLSLKNFKEMEKPNIQDLKTKNMITKAFDSAVARYYV